MFVLTLNDTPIFGSQFFEDCEFIKNSWDNDVYDLKIFRAMGSASDTRYLMPNRHLFRVSIVVEGGDFYHFSYCSPFLDNEVTATSLVPLTIINSPIIETISSDIECVSMLVEGEPSKEGFWTMEKIEETLRNFYETKKKEKTTQATTPLRRDDV